MLAAAVLWTALVAQAAPPPPPSPTALIAGRVLDASSGRPVAGAVVSLGGGAGAAGPRSQQPRAMTNTNGYFVFRKLGKGSYPLTATRPGYVDGAYGRRRPNGSASAVVLPDDNTRVSDIVIPIWRQATIAGTVTDEAGEPVIGAEIRAFERRLVAGHRRLVQGPTATTDDRGFYRLTLTPGEYVVGFVWHESSIPAATSALIFASAGSPAVQQITRERFTMGGGAALAPSGSSMSVEVAGGLVRDLPSSSAIPPPAADDRAIMIYPTQFYPGVPSPARASAIALASGQERQGVDFSLTPAKTVRVSGTLLGPEGPVPNAGVRLVPSGDDLAGDLDASATLTGAGGEFTLLGVPPGQYTLKVLRLPSSARPVAPSSTTMTQIQMGSSTVMTSTATPNTALPSVSDDPTLFAEMPVSVGGRDVTDLLVTLARGARLAGRIEFDGTRGRPEAAELARVTIVLDRADATPAFMPFSAPPPGRADATGSFKTYGVAPGRYIARIGGGFTGWTLKSVTVEGRDISESPVDLRTSDVPNVVVTFTDRPTRLTGTARTDDGNADGDAVVVVFPADRSAWSDYGLNPRRVRSAHASRDGSYTFSGLPSGDYYVAAIHEDTTAQWQDPKVLENLAGRAAQIRLADGDTRAQDVKTVKGGTQ